MLEITEEKLLKQQKTLREMTTGVKNKSRRKKEVTVDLGSFQVTFLD